MKDGGRMKAKTDFVTNSSSTSFVLAKDKNKDDNKIKITMEMSIGDLFKGLRDYQIIRDKDDLDEYIIENCYDDKSKDEVRTKYTKLLETEKEILILSFNSEEGGFQSAVRDNPDSIKFGDGIEIIAQYEG